LFGGTLATLFPVMLLRWLGLSSVTAESGVCQCLGISTAVFGVGYVLASRNPFRHWLMTLVGLIGKFSIPVVAVVSISNDVVPASITWTFFVSEAIWWIPFAMILWGTFRHSQAFGSAYDTPESDDPRRDLLTNSGLFLDDLAKASPQLVVFLRHAGCTFCRQTLAAISQQRKQIEATGCGIVFVHLGSDPEADEEFFRSYGLSDVPRISDPSCRMYRQFGLDLGSYPQLFGLRVWIRGLIAGIVNGHGIGAIQGNSFQMPGAYIYHCGQILGGYRHGFASDRPDYAAMARELADYEPVVAL
jgi:hypothetical protein